MSALPEVKALVFDVFGTVVKRDESVFNEKRRIPIKSDTDPT